MNDDINEEVIYDNEQFPNLNMTVDEKNFYLNEIVRKCKDICDTENKVANKSKCDILRMWFKKENDIIYIDGYLTIGDDKTHENRYVTGSIYRTEDEIVSSMDITRLCVDDDNKEYTVIDKFKPINGKLSRESEYFYKVISKRRHL